MTRKMLIDATHAEETRVVVVDGNKVDEFDFESLNKRQLAGNIYLAKVTRVEPSLQAAFVDYGGNRHGFLAFSEIHPDYYQIPKADREAFADRLRQICHEVGFFRRIAFARLFLGINIGHIGFQITQPLLDFLIRRLQMHSKLRSQASL